MNRMSSCGSSEDWVPGIPRFELSEIKDIIVFRQNANDDCISPCISRQSLVVFNVFVIRCHALY